jgi:hypothetical protein
VALPRRYCIEPGCPKRRAARGWCAAHWAQQKRAGILAKPCVEESCTGFAMSRGLCGMHYQRARQEGRFSDVKCVLSECGLPATWSSFCKKHGDRVRKYGLSLDQLTALDQGLPCAVSGEISKTLSVDHCEDANAVRGFITNKINMALGLFDHAPRLLRRAAEYLEDFQRLTAHGLIVKIPRRTK